MPAALTVRDEVVTHTAAGGWTYTTVIAEVPEPLSTVANIESTELRWVSEDIVESLPLHPAFAKAWPELRDHLRTL